MILLPNTKKMSIKNSHLFLALSLLIIFSCNSSPKKLPIYGERNPVSKLVNGKEKVDTLYQSIPAFSFLNQDSVLITSKSLDGKIYIADFFFTSCPSICPIMKKQMLRVYKEYEGNEQVKFLSHTIDPKHDSISVLKDYANKLGANSKQWYFLYGNRDSIYHIAKNSYMSISYEDKNTPGGIVHSGYFILVDKQKHIRGAYDGTNTEQVSQLIKDVQILLDEYDMPTK